MSALQPHELAMFQNLKRTAIVLLLLLRMDRPVGEGEIAESLDINPETARTYLRSLAEQGLITRIGGRYGGYQLTVGGRQMMLPLDALTLPENTSGNAENPRSSAENPRSPLPEIVEISEKVDHSSSAENPRSSAENPRSSAENPRSSAENPRSRKSKNSLNNNNNKESLNQEVVVVRAHTKRRAAKTPKTPAAEKQDRRARLVGEGVLPKICEELAERPEITLEHITAWAVVLKAQWGRAYTPGNLVSALRYIRAGDPVPWTPAQETPAGNGGGLETPDEAVEVEPAVEGEDAPAVEPATVVVGWDGQGADPVAAWQMVLGEIEIEHRAMFRQWLKPTRLGRVAHDQYSVICPSADHVAWLTARLTTTIETLLTGCRNTPATVHFVTELSTD